MATIRKHVTRDVVALEATAPIREAARLMAEQRIGSIAVKEGGRIVGLVTERDLVLTVLARGGDAAQPIREAMRAGLPRVQATATEVETAALMRDHTTRHLLVEEEGQVAGVVSMRDIIQLMLDEKQFLIDQLQTYIDGR
ncbi:CBS domain-containing protein [Anaeromyxobacter oryzae]|uniref:Inosine-5-monophosphate dehydrogenase n=1 Tax=Anaeromyxobacter oryzae TaxID=2918170 RepID=A0ABM7X0W8_9BACT|nr:CBS domain-containing protein [Anaeromyxobacter oryzae]BDG05361.1 inosine-5-monophosphate dehydrogenase [Anaeromyxobacter oryzae]